MNKLQDIIFNSDLFEFEDTSDNAIAISMIKIYKYDVVIYGGGGNAGRFIVRVLRRENIEPLYIIDSDASKSGSSLENIEIISIPEIKNKIHKPDNTYVLIATSYFNSMEQNKITKVLHENNLNKYFYFTNIEGVKCDWIGYYINHVNDINRFYDILEDEESKNTLVEYIRVVMKNNIYSLTNHMSRYKYWGCDDCGNDDIYRHIPDENWINCGSANGDTIYKFLAMGYKFGNIFGFEGDKKIYNLLKVNIDLLPNKFTKNISIFNQFLGGNSTDFKFDEYFANTPISLINMDIEGAELSTLKLIKNLISKHKPVLAVCLYHKKEDIVDIPPFIKECNADYHFFLRKYSYNLQDIAYNKDEMVLYAVPSNRLIKKYDNAKRS